MLDTDQLRSFLAIVDLGSFTRAADRLNKTQSAVSMHMRRLEERLGCELFVKQGRGVRLSTEGEKLIEYARRMLQIEASAIATITRKGLAGRLRLGIPDDYAGLYLADILNAFIRLHPLVEVSVLCEASVALAERVQSRDIDIAVATDCHAISGIEVVREEPLVLVAHPRLRTDLASGVPLAVGQPSCNWRATVERVLGQAGIKTRVLLASNNFAAIEPVVRAGLAATPLPIGALRGDLRVVTMPGVPALGLTRMGILTSPARPSPETLAMADAIRQVLTPGTQALSQGPIARQRVAAAPQAVERGDHIGAADVAA